MVQCCCPQRRKIGKDEYVYHSCGRCPACCQNIRNDWVQRMKHEAITSNGCLFLTLTFDDEHLGNNSVEKEEVQKFMKRFRYYAKEKIRYFAVSEYGKQFGRKHYHIILYNTDISDNPFYSVSYDSKKGGFWCYCRAWHDIKQSPIGHCFVKIPSDYDFAYTAKYITKSKQSKGRREFNNACGKNTEFTLVSRCPGLGKKWLDFNFDKLRKNPYIKSKQFKLRLPRYYEDKIYPKGSDEREQHMMEKQQILSERWKEAKKNHKQKHHTFEEYEKMQLEQLEKNLRRKCGEDNIEDTFSRYARKSYNDFYRNLEKRKREDCGAEEYSDVPF